MNIENLTKFYQSGEKHYDMPDFETFKVDMQDDIKLSKYIANMSNHYEVKDIEEVKVDLFGEQETKPTSPSLKQFSVTNLITQADSVVEGDDKKEKKQQRKEQRAFNKAFKDFKNQTWYETLTLEEQEQEDRRWEEEYYRKKEEEIKKSEEKEVKVDNKITVSIPGQKKDIEYDYISYDEIKENIYANAPIEFYNTNVTYLKPKDLSNYNEILSPRLDKLKKVINNSNNKTIDGDYEVLGVYQLDLSNVNKDFPELQEGFRLEQFKTDKSSSLPTTGIEQETVKNYYVAKIATKIGSNDPKQETVPFVADEFFLHNLRADLRAGNQFIPDPEVTENLKIKIFDLESEKREVGEENFKKQKELDQLQRELDLAPRSEYSKFLLYNKIPEDLKRSQVRISPRAYDVIDINPEDFNKYYMDAQKYKAELESDYDKKVNEIKEEKKQAEEELKKLDPDDLEAFTTKAFIKKYQAEIDGLEINKEEYLKKEYARIDEKANQAYQEYEKAAKYLTIVEDIVGEGVAKPSSKVLPKIGKYFRGISENDGIIEYEVQGTKPEYYLGFVNSEETAKDINNYYLPYSISAIETGYNNLLVLKNAKYKANGEVDWMATAEKNLSSSDYQETKEAIAKIDNMTQMFSLLPGTTKIVGGTKVAALKELLKNRGFAYELDMAENTPSGLNVDVKPEDFKGFLKFIDKNKESYNPNFLEDLGGNLPYLTDDNIYSFDSKQTKIKEEIKTLTNTSKTRIKELEKVTKNIINKGNKTTNLEKQVEENFKTSERKIIRSKKTQEEITKKYNEILIAKNKLQKNQDEYVKILAKDREGVIIEGDFKTPLESRTYKKYLKNQDEISKIEFEEKELEKRFNEENDKQNSLVEEYSEIYNTLSNEVYEINNLSLQSDQIKSEISQLIEEINVYASTSNVLALSSEEVQKARKKVLKLAEGKGSVFSQITKSFGEGLAEVNTGRMIAASELANVINFIDYKFGGKSESKYKYDKQQIESDIKSAIASKKSIGEVFQIGKTDEVWMKNWNESTSGQVIDTFVQMFTSSLGSPATGMTGGYFLGTLAQVTEQNNQMLEDYIKQKIYAYTKATASSVFAMMTGRIIQGGGKYSSKIIDGITNKVLLTTVNRTTRDIQISINKEVGDLIYRFMKRGADKIAMGFEEFAQEELELAVDMGIDNLFEKMTSVDFQVPEIGSKQFMENVKQTGIVSFLAGNIGGTFHAAKNRFLGNPSTTANLFTDFERNNSFKQRKILNEEFKNQITTLSNSENYNNQVNRLQNLRNLSPDLFKLTLTNEVYDQNLSEKQQKERIAQIQKTSADDLLAIEIQKLGEIHKMAGEVDNNLNGIGQKNQLALLSEINKLNKKIQGKEDSPAVAGIKEKINQYRTRLKEISEDYRYQDTKSIEQSINEATEKVKLVVDGENLNDVQEIIKAVQEKGKNDGLSQEEIDEKIEKIKPSELEIVTFSENNKDEILEKYNIDEDQLVDENGNFHSNGGYIPDQNVLLLEEGSGSDTKVHEVTHLMWKNALKKVNNKQVTQTISDEIMKEMKARNPELAEILEQHIAENYASDENYTPTDVAEETIAYFNQYRNKPHPTLGGFETTVEKEDKIFKSLAEQTKRLFRGYNTNTVINKDNIVKVLEDFVINLEKGKLSKFQEKLLKGDAVFEFDVTEEVETPTATEEETTPVAVEEEVQVEPKFENDLDKVLEGDEVIELTPKGKQESEERSMAASKIMKSIPLDIKDEKPDNKKVRQK